MKESLEKFIKAAFSIFVLIAIIGGGIVFLMFVAGIIIGGDTGNSLALSASKTMMPIFIRCAAIAVLAGLIHYYVLGEHALTMDDNK